MKSVAIVIATQYGQTEKIASTTRAQIVRLGVYAEIFKPPDNGCLPSIDLDKFGAVIIGGPIYVGKFPAPLVKWTDDHLETLNTKMTAFFTSA